MKQSSHFRKILSALICLPALMGLVYGQEPQLQKPERINRNNRLPHSLACATYAGQASREEIAATPRSDTDLERLAIAMGETFTANQAIYNRVVGEVAAIREINPQLVFTYRGADNGKSLILRVEPLAFEQMKSGRYRPWACANEFYVLTETRFIDSLQFVFLRFKGIYNLNLLAKEYAKLPGVRTADPDRWLGDGSDICGTVEGDIFHYVFDLASGDCPSGCINHHLFYFTSWPGSAPEYMAEWRIGEGTAPYWARRYGRCFS